jgi:hypothetical protein
MSSMPAAAMGPSQRRKLMGLVSFDPNFSIVVLEDFLYALYARVQEARGGGRLELVGAYLAETVQQKLAASSAGVSEVSEVVIGSMRIVAVQMPDRPGARVRASVLFEANYAERGADGLRKFYAVERWELSRRADAHSRDPEQATKIVCPSCSAALDAMQGNTCTYCGKVANTGQFDWVVDGVEQFSKEPREPELGGDVAEQGTELATLTDPGMLEALALLKHKDPEFDVADLTARAGMIFGELQAAWSAREWAKVRPFVSDNLFQMQLYWMETFKRRKVINELKQMKVERIEPAAVASDAHFDSVTLRIFASGLDYYVDEATRRVVSGSPRFRRSFSEYWTFIRGVGVKGKAGVEKKCPNCGAPLKINQGGQCEYCKARVTSGQFDWVLSRIEQDEAYQG